MTEIASNVAKNSGSNRHFRLFISTVRKLTASVQYILQIMTEDSKYSILTMKIIPISFFKSTSYLLTKKRKVEKYRRLTLHAIFPKSISLRTIILRYPYDSSNLGY